MPRPRVYEKDDPAVNTQVRVPRSLHGRLRAEARERDVSINHIVILAIKEWLSKHVR